MGLCYSVKREQPDLTSTIGGEQFIAIAPTAVIVAEHTDALGSRGENIQLLGDDIKFKPEDSSIFFRTLHLYPHALFVEGGCFSFPGYLSDAGAQRPVLFTIARRSHFSDNASLSMYRLAEQPANTGLLRRLAFIVEHITCDPPGPQQQSSTNGNSSPPPIHVNMYRSYAGSGADFKATKHPRSVLWSSCPATHGQPLSSDPNKSIALCISGPCQHYASTVPAFPTPALAAQNPDIAAALSNLPLVEGQKLLACVEELPEFQGNLLQAMQSLQTRGHLIAGPLVGKMVTYALEIAQAVASLHQMGLHHGFLTPAVVLLVPRNRTGQNTHATTSTSDPTTAADPQPQAASYNPSDPRGEKSVSPPASRGLRCRLALSGMVNPVEYASRLAYNAAGWGAVSYLAPECFSVDAASVSHESLTRMDTHSFGALCYHLFTGAAPYHQYHAAQVLVGINSGGLKLLWPPPGGSSCRPPVPETIRLLITRCLDRSPEARPTFQEIVSLLGGARRDSDVAQ